MNKVIFYTASLIVGIMLSLTSINAEEINALELLKRDLGDTIEVHQNNEVWYCPDNTCEMFKSKSLHNDFSKYVYLFLFHKSEYVYLNMSFGEKKAFRSVAVEEPVIRQLVSSYCPEGQKGVNCLLDGMKTKLGVEVGFGRYDEGLFCYSYEDKETKCEKYE